MSDVDVLDTAKWSPHQALLKALDYVDDMEFVAVTYMEKSGGVPHLVLSTMSPADMNFLGFALQNYSVSFMKD